MNFTYEAHQIYVKNEKGETTVLATFPFIKEGVVNVNHTYVDPSMRGQGVASLLMHEVYKHTKQLGYKVVATCPYAVVWFKRNKDYNDILDQETQAELSPECQI